MIERIHEQDEKQRIGPEFKASLERRIREIDEGKLEGKDAFECLDEF